MKNYWTKSKVDKLSNLWSKGVPAREIANKLGNVSRNAVIGKANRLGLSKKAKKQESRIEEKDIILNSLIARHEGL